MRVLFSALYKMGSESPGKDGPVLLTSASELSSLGYFQRRTVAEMMLFFSRQFAKGAKEPGQRSSVKEQGYLCHVYVSPAGVVAACFADEEYPTRVAFGYLSKLCEDFLQVTGGNLANANSDGAFDSAFQAIHTKLLTQFQDPAQADQLTRIMAELEQTKLVLHETIEAALERGTKIDTLINKSNDLSGSSKMFFKTAKKQNQCCTFM